MPIIVHFATTKTRNLLKFNYATFIGINEENT